MEILLGAAIGAIAGLALTLLAQPLLEDPARSLLIRLLGRFPVVRGRTDVDGEWCFLWWPDGVAVDVSQEKALRLRTVGARVAGKFEWRGRSYQMVGSRHTPSFISGTYVDERDGNVFHGAFQLRVLPGDRLMEGRWIGFNSDLQILSGPWYLRRSGEPDYSHQRPKPGS